MLFSHSFAGAFGIDIGDLSLKLVQLRQTSTISGTGRWAVRTARTMALPAGLIVNGEIEQPELVRKKLLQLIGRDGSTFPKLKTRWAVVNLPEPKTFLKLITIDVSPDTLTEADVTFQARTHLPFELGEVYLDWQLVGPEEATRVSQVLIGAASKIIADSYTYLLESAGLTALALEIEALAITRTLITRTKTYRGEARALLDLGATRSSLIIYDQGSIQFSVNIAFSGELITTAIMQQLGVDHATAEQLRLENGLTHTQKYPRYINAVGRMTDLLLTRLDEALAFYREHFPNGNPVTHITMCGGLAALINLDRVIANKLKISAQLGNVWKNVAATAPRLMQEAPGATLASAIGLAIRAAENPLGTIV